MNPFDDPGAAAHYDEWYSGPGRRADQLEKRLLRKLLDPQVRTILEIGSGTGHFTRWFRDLGFLAVGVDRSAAMLREAGRRNGATYVRGDAGSLPFADRSFDAAAMITALEFVPDPARALAEAGRVARCGLLLGVLNRHSLMAVRHRRSGKPLWKSARFFSPGELRRLVLAAVGSRVAAIDWRTTLWPLRLPVALPLPWGGFVGMMVRLRD